MIDKKKLALIHIVKKELQLTDEQYHSLLRTAAGVTSAKDLDEITFRKLMSYFVHSKLYRPKSAGLTFRQKMFIAGLVEHLQWTENHFSNFVHKYYGTYDVSALKRKDAAKLIESLKNVIAHQRK